MPRSHLGKFRNTFNIHNFLFKMPFSNSAYPMYNQNIIHKSPQSSAHIPPYPPIPPQPLIPQNNRVHPHQSMIFYPDGNKSESMNQEHYAPYSYDDDAEMGGSIDNLFGGACVFDNDDVGDTSSLPSINSLLSTAVQMF